MGPRGQKVLLRYACKKELDMHVYSQGAAADGEVAADDARAGSGGGGARARPSCTLISSQSMIRARKLVLLAMRGLLSSIGERYAPRTMFIHQSAPIGTRRRAAR